MTKHSYKRIEPEHPHGYHSIAITNRMNLIFRYIVRYSTAYGSIPSRADICELSNLSGRNVDYILSLLCKDGKLRKTGYGAYELIKAIES